MDSIHTEQVGKLTIDIIPDDDIASHDNPFAEDWEGMAMHLSLGREGDIKTPNVEDLTRDTIGAWLNARKVTDKASQFKGWTLYPVYAYIHSGVSLSLGSFDGRVPEGHARFDSGLCGVLLLQGRKSAKLQKRAEAIIQTANDWVQGNVYGYTVTDEGGEEMDSCWGFMGDWEESGVLQQARDYANSHTNND